MSAPQSPGGPVQPAPPPLPSPPPAPPPKLPPKPADEERWLERRDVAQEAVFSHVGGALLTPGSFITDERGQPSARLGRNLLVESEHSANQRSARELLRGKATAKDEAESAADIASRGPDDGAVAYLRDNADSLTEGLATKQAKAAQTLIDSYGELATLRQNPKDVRELMPANELEQARWVNRAQRDIQGSLEGVPSHLAKPVLEQAAKLGTSVHPERWFTSASSLSDELLRVSARAARNGDTDAAERLTVAKQTLDRGLNDPGLWGEAARVEGQRADGYSRRYGEHIDQFEALFTTESATGERVVTADKFRELLNGTEDAPAREALRAAIDGARATADVARKFGRSDKAAEIDRSIALLERTGKQGAAVRTARGVSRGTLDPSAAAMEWLARGGVPGSLLGASAQRQLSDSAMLGVETPAAEAAAATLAARGGAYRAANALTQRSAEDAENGLRGLFAPQEMEPEDDDDLAERAQTPERVNLANYDATREHIDKMARDPLYFGSVMAASFGTLPEAAPEIFDALAQQTQKVVQYLSVIAPGGQTGGPFAQRFAVGEDELWEYNQRFNAVTDPEFVPRQVATGRVTSQAIEAFEAINPRQYGELQLAMFERLAELRARGIPVPIQTREQIDVTLNIDGGGDPALTWKVAERGYAAIARKNSTRSQRPDGGGDTGMTSGALATLNNGASAIAQTG